MVKNILFEKLNRVIETLSSKGISGLGNLIAAYVKYNHKDKWKFTYFGISLHETPYSLPPINDLFVIRIAKPEDISKIKSDIYPSLTSKQENDKRDFLRIGESGFTCIIAERENKIVHYFLVYHSALNSPLIKTAFNKAKILENDAYLGATFTAPDARGLWIVPHSILYLLSFLKSNTNASRALLLVHEDTPGGIGFYQRLGFKIIEKPIAKSIMNAFAKGLGHLKNK